MRDFTQFPRLERYRAQLQTMTYERADAAQVAHARRQFAKVLALLSDIDRDEVSESLQLLTMLIEARAPIDTIDHFLRQLDQDSSADRAGSKGER